MCRLLELDCSLNVMRIHGESTMSIPAQLEAWTTQRDRARGILQAFGTRTEYEDSYGSSQASTSVPCGPAWQQPPLPPTVRRYGVIFTDPYVYTQYLNTTLHRVRVPRFSALWRARCLARGSISRNPVYLYATSWRDFRLICGA